MLQYQQTTSDFANKRSISSMTERDTKDKQNIHRNALLEIKNKFNK